MWVSKLLWSKRYKQYLCACSVTLLTTATFMYITWPSPTIPLLTSSDSPIGVQLTKEQASWVTSVTALGMLPGAIVAGILMDRIGRKKSLFIACLLLFIPWIVILLSVSVTTLLVARVIGGFGSGLVSGVVSMYMGEISEKQIRGRLTTIPTLSTAISAIIVLGAGPFVSFTTLIFICGSLPFLFLTTYFFMPESPYYLVKKNQNQAAYKVLDSLSKATKPDSWLKEIESTVQHDEACELTVKKLFTQRNYRKSLLLVIAMKTLQQFSGLFAINAYIQTIMKSSNTSLSAETSSAIFAGIQIPCVFVAAYLVDKLGRRPLLIVSSAGCALALIGEGIYFYFLETQDVDLSSVYYLPTLCLTIYFIMVSTGVSNMIYVVSAELFTTNVKKVGGSVFSFYSGFLSFISLKMFNPIVEAWGMYTMFWIFAGVCVLGMCFGLFVLPETKGKSFDEIQDMLHGKKKTEGTQLTTLNITKC